jgi:hypothetical protein
MDLGDLNWVLLRLMPWSGFHLHAFTVNGVDYNEPEPEYGSDMEDEAEAQLSELIAGSGFKFSYEFDFGDCWMHDILVEKILPLEAGTHYPVCLAGKRACPPEDCGGIWGYANLLDAIRDPKHEEHDELLEWIGGSFDPEAFDLDAVNQRLKKIRSR